MSDADERGMEMLRRTVRPTNGGYEAGLLWAEDNPNLPNSRPMCESRANNLQRRMEKSPQLAEILEGIISDYEHKGYIKEVSGIKPQDPWWLLPIFPVINPNKPEKCRLVWDGAAKVDGQSLNSFLVTGPDLLVPLVDILIRFR